MQNTIFSIIIFSNFAVSMFYGLRSYQHFCTFIKLLHKHRHHDWIEFGAPDAPFWKGSVRENYRVTHKTSYSSFHRTFLNSIPAFKKKFQEEEIQRILERYQRDSRLSTIFLIAFGISIFAAIAISPK